MTLSTRRLFAGLCGDQQGRVQQRLHHCRRRQGAQGGGGGQEEQSRQAQPGEKLSAA